MSSSQEERRKMEPHDTSAAKRYDWKRFDFIIVCFCILMSVFVGAYIFWRKSLNFKLKALPGFCSL